MASVGGAFVYGLVMLVGSFVRGMRAPAVGVLVVLGSGALGCGGKLLPFTAEKVVDYLVPEEHSIRTTCELLALEPPNEASSFTSILKGAPNSEGMKTAAQNADQTLSKLRKNDVETNVRALFSALGLSSCKDVAVAPERILKGDVGWLDQGSACYSELNSTIEQWRNDKQEPATEAQREIKKLVKALENEGEKDEKKTIDAAAVLGRMLSIARRLDFSPAVVLALVRLAEGAEDLADQLAQSVTWGTGLVRIALRQVAAELVAEASDEVLALLERNGYVSPASVARSACGLYSTTSRGVVVSHTLRRAVLRFHPWPTAEAAATKSKAPPEEDSKEYPGERLCTSLRSKAGDACREMWIKLHGDERRPPPLAPSYEATASKVASTGKPDPATDIFPQLAADGFGQTLKSATHYCALDEKESHEKLLPECTLETLSSIASILRVFQHEIHAEHQQFAGDLELVRAELGAMGKTLGSLRQSVDNLNSSVNVLTEQLKKSPAPPPAQTDLGPIMDVLGRIEKARSAPKPTVLSSELEQKIARGVKSHSGECSTCVRLVLEGKCDEARSRCVRRTSTCVDTGADWALHEIFHEELEAKCPKAVPHEHR